MKQQEASKVFTEGMTPEQTARALEIESKYKEYNLTPNYASIRGVILGNRIVIKYDWIGAHNAGVNKHPQKHLQEIGIRTFAYEAMGIADCAFIEVDKLPNPCPEYIQTSDFYIY